MKLFISWSGKISETVALRLKDWLSDVIQELKPYVSSEDIRKGSRWFNEIGRQLDETNFGIICLTADNLSEPWILFEAGALSKKLDQSHVVPLLIGMSKADLIDPLAQFQATSLEKEDVKKLLKHINEQLKDKALDEPRLNKAFERYWPDLENVHNQALELAKKAAKEKVKSTREPQDMIEEILLKTREIASQLSELGARTMLPVGAQVLASTFPTMGSTIVGRPFHTSGDFINFPIASPGMQSPETAAIKNPGIQWSKKEEDSR